MVDASRSRSPCRVKMKRNRFSMLCLSLLLLYIDFSFAKRGGGGSFSKSFGRSFKKGSTSSGSSSHTTTDTGHKSSQGSSGYPKQAGGYPPQSDRPAYPGAGWSGSYGRYSGGYINHNPNNKVLSPHYGGSFGYGGYGVGRGSPYSQSVQAMGMHPSNKSREFGHRAVMSAAGGAMAGMALGYGLGRFPRPHFNFHSPQEEYYYNHYMYRKYGVKSTDTNDYSRDYKFTQPPLSYDSYMGSCMKRTDVLPVENNQPKEKAPAVTSALDTGSNTIETKSSATEDSSPAPRPVNQPEANPMPPDFQVASDTEDSDTVSVVEIGYPALIEQLKARRCLELYIVYSVKYLDRARGGAQRLEMSLQGLLAIVTGILMMLLNSNMLVLCG